MLIMTSSKALDGLSAVVLGITFSGVYDISSGFRRVRERDDLYFLSQYYLDVWIDVMLNPWTQ